MNRFRSLRTHPLNNEAVARTLHRKEHNKQCSSQLFHILIVAAVIVMSLAILGFQYLKKEDAEKSFCSGSDGSNIITVSEQPNDVIARKGDIAVFSIETDDEQCAYQWQTSSKSDEAWVNISGEGNQTSKLSVDTNSLDVNLGNYYYRCLITDQAGNTVPSDAASLIVWAYDEGTKTLTIRGRGQMPNWEWDGSNAPWHRELMNASTIIVQDGIENIGSYAFWDTAGFGSQAIVYIPRTVKSIGAHALGGWIKDFEVNSDNPVYQSIDGTLFDKSGSTLIRVPGGRTGRYIVPKGTSAIADWAFEWCAYIQEIDLPDGVTMIGDYAFSNCKALTELVLPEGLLTIGNHIFKPEAMIIGRPVLSIPHSVQFIGENYFGHVPGMAEINVYYAGTEEDWHSVKFATPEGISGDYIIYYLNERSDDYSNNCPWFDYAGRWTSGQCSESTGNFYEEELTIRFTGNNSFVFTWHKHDVAKPMNLCATLDPETGIASFGDQIDDTVKNERGIIMFRGETVTLRIESSSQNEIVPDGYEVTFTTKESDHLQSAKWFA